MRADGSKKRATRAVVDRRGGMRIDADLDVKLTRLRELLLTARDFSEISDYFHAVLVPDDAFMISGDRAEQPRLVTALKGVLRILEPSGQWAESMILRLDRHAMCHGLGRWGRGFALFFYFEALDLGFCSYARTLTDPEVTFTRFRLTNTNVANPKGKPN